jgi:hypothetical protein
VDQRSRALIGEQFEQDRMRCLAVDDDHAFDACFQRIDAGLDLGIMPPEMVPSAISLRASLIDSSG